jgi:hypothetical protein
MNGNVPGTGREILSVAVVGRQSSVVSQGRGTLFEQDSTPLNKRYLKDSREPDVNEAPDIVDALLMTDD